MLVIEDRPSIGMVFDLALTEEGHKVEVVSDGSSGLKILQGEAKTDLVILDLNMPGISGREVVEIMRSENELLRNIPVIIVSGSVPSPDIMPPEGSYQAFIGKPFDLNEVIETVDWLTTAEAAC
ncbi:MAG: response regulator [Bacillota bacterium]|nr:response regulator [Bacillota bacterium]MDW7684215.1 response regulator [Bacillota bacterium]